MDNEKRYTNKEMVEIEESARARADELPHIKLKSNPPNKETIEKVREIKARIEQVLKDSETGFVHIRFQPEEIYGLCEALEVLLVANEFYAQKPVPDIHTEFAKSSGKWGEHVVTWEPLTDMGEKARQALTRVEEILK